MHRSDLAFGCSTSWVRTSFVPAANFDVHVSFFVHYLYVFAEELGIVPFLDLNDEFESFNV